MMDEIKKPGPPLIESKMRSFTVEVKDGDINWAIIVLKRLVAKDGIFGKLRERNRFIKKSERVREKWRKVRVRNRRILHRSERQ